MTRLPKLDPAVAETRAAVRSALRNALASLADAGRGAEDRPLVLVALSGGADSVALLILLCRARDAGMLRVSAAHFEHGIRGAESIADKDFCQKLCERMCVPLALGRADVPEIARRTGEGLELLRQVLTDVALEHKAALAAASESPDTF